MKSGSFIVLLVLSLLMVNFASAVHIYMSEGGDMQSEQIVQPVGDSSEDTSSATSSCYQCCCHAGVHMMSSGYSVGDLRVSSSKPVPMDDRLLYSQLNSPPFQPPRA